MNIYLRNMVTGKELAASGAEQERPLSLKDEHLQSSGCQVGFSARMVARLCDVIASRVPSGYEDEYGFHYGADLAG